MSGFWPFLDLEQLHQSVQIFYLFCKKTILFLFYTPIFTKHPHQFVYSTIYFIQIIIFLTFLLLFPFSPTTLPNSPKYFLHSLSLYFPPSSCSFFFYSFFSFLSPSYIFSIFIFFFSFSFSFSFFFFFFFYLSLIMASDFGFAILVVILGRFFHYMDGDFGALHWLLLILQHLVLLLFLHFLLLLLLQFGFDYLYGFEIYIYIYILRRELDESGI